MAVEISGIEEGSLAERLGVSPGDILLSINGHEIRDVLDFRFYETERELKLLFSRDGEEFSSSLRKPQYASLGLKFETFLMDRQRSCRNKCIFCFIDQMPPGMRESLYFKDDDDRLSFLFGNYITLTNIDEKEIERIIEMRISPVNVSVHTMDPKLRCEMMGNRFAGESLKYLYRLAHGGIKLNCQLVLCPGINDGDALDFTMEKLFSLGESLQSVAAVPVGLTKFREGLYPLKAYDRLGALEVIERLSAWGERFLKECGRRVVYPSDEFYLLAQIPIPPLEFYEDFPQIENGVGMLRNFEDEFSLALSDYEEEGKLPKNLSRRVTVPTGECGVKFIDGVMDLLREKCPKISIDLLPVHNDFFGGTVNVTGLLTGGDIIVALEGRELGDELLIPTAMLKADEDIFLDDLSLGELSRRLKIPARRMGAGGEDCLRCILGLENLSPRGFGTYEGAGN